MTIEQCCDTLFKSMESLAILQFGLLGFYGIIMLHSLGKIEEKLDKLLKNQEEDGNEPQ